MNQNPIRHNYFRILSRLYDLASEFSVDELTDVRQAFLERRNISHATVVDALIDIHNNTTFGIEHSVDPVPLQSPKAVEFGTSPKTRQADNAERRKYVAMRNLLMMPEVFSGISDIASIPSVGIEPRHKESRAKYVKRIMSSYSELPPDGKKLLSKEVADFAARKSSKSFVSKWSALIKDL